MAALRAALLPLFPVHAYFAALRAAVPASSVSFSRAGQRRLLEPPPPPPPAVRAVAAFLSSVLVLFGVLRAAVPAPSATAVFSWRRESSPQKRPERPRSWVLRWHPGLPSAELAQTIVLATKVKSLF